VDVKQAVGHAYEPLSVTYTEKDVALYALSVGICSKDPLDSSQLQFVYENHTPFRVLPTMGVVFPAAVLTQIVSTPGLSFNPMMLLHGEQYLEIRRPIPTSGTLTTSAHLSNIFDKGKGALVLVDAVTKDEAGREIVFNQFSLFIRGIGGFGGDRGSGAEHLHAIPNRAPDAVAKDTTAPNQAILYRLNGDVNPLHIDPNLASLGGFERPILHGLCTFGYAGRAVLEYFCANNPDHLKSIRVRFTRHVFPGETIMTEMWRVSSTRVLFQCRVAERPEHPVLSNCCVELQDASAKL